MATKITQHQPQALRVDPPIIDVTPEPVTEIGLRDVFMMIRRRGALFLGIVGVICGLTIAYMLQATPLFTAEGEIVIDQRGGRVSNLDSVIVTAPGDETDVPNETAVLQSRDLAAKVVAELNLEQDPEFNPLIVDASMEPGPFVKAVEEIQYMAGDALATLGIVEIEAEPALDNDVVRSMIIDTFLERLTIETVETSRVITIKFESADPKKSALIVNTLLATYLENQMEHKRAATENAIEWLEGMVASLRTQAAKAKETVDQFRRDSGLISANGSDLTSQQISELTSQRVVAQGELAASEARLQRLLAMVRSGGGMDSAQEVLSSPLVQSLRQQEAEVLRRRSEYSTRYGDKHPTMVEVRAELRDLRAKIKTEVDKIVEAQSNEVAIARARVAALGSSLAQLEGAAVDTNVAEAQIADLEAEAGNARELYQTFLVRLAETRAQKEIIQPDAQIISDAAIPIAPSFPNKPKMLAFAGLGSIILATLTVLVASSMQRGFETSEQVERLLRLRSLGLLAGVPFWKARVTPPEELIIREPFSSWGESMQGLRSNLFLSNGSSHPKTLLFTSSLPKEGKTTLALSYARFCAASGQKVLLIDCDLAKPKLHTKLHVDNDQGIAEVLTDQIAMADAIRHDSKSHIDYVTSGHPPFAATEMLSAQKMKDLLAQLSWNYDLIVIDSSPVLAVTDAHVLAQLVESTVMLVQWRRTPREVARQAVNRLESMGVKSVAGFVLSKVNTRKYAHSGYSASGALNYRNNARRRGRKLIGAQAEVAATVSQRH